MKAVEAERKKDLDNKRKESTSKVTPPRSTAKPGPELKDGKPVFGSKAATATEAPSLFDSHEPAETAGESLLMPTSSSGAQSIEGAVETVVAAEEVNV